MQIAQTNVPFVQQFTHNWHTLDIWQNSVMIFAFINKQWVSWRRMNLCVSVCVCVCQLTAVLTTIWRSPQCHVLCSVRSQFVRSDSSICVELQPVHHRVSGRAWSSKMRCARGTVKHATLNCWCIVASMLKCLGDTARLRRAFSDSHVQAHISDHI